MRVVGRRRVSVPLRGLGVFGEAGWKEYAEEDEGFRPLAGIRGIRRLDVAHSGD